MEDAGELTDGIDELLAGLEVIERGGGDDQLYAVGLERESPGVAVEKRGGLVFVASRRLGDGAVFDIEAERQGLAEVEVGKYAIVAVGFFKGIGLEDDFGLEVAGPLTDEFKMRVAFLERS